MHPRQWSINLILGLIGLAVSTVASPCAAQERELKVRGDQARILKEGYWIYNDLAKGLEQGKQQNKPVLVIFRCIPCEACAQLDEAVVEDNPAVRKWLSNFVPVRIVHTNGMDMNKFQFDYDQSWAAFVLHHDGSIIGRYGTRSHQTESADDVSLQGFLESLRVAQSLYANYDSVRAQLAAKIGPPAPVAHPEEFPKLKEKYGSKLDYEGKVVASCIHCHQVGEALLAWNRRPDQPLPQEILYPYPNPKILGVVMDPLRARTVKSVTENSPAAKAGLQAGDVIVQCQQQPIISTADLQWVLHRIGDGRQLNLKVVRGKDDAELLQSDSKVDLANHSRQLTLELPEKWREQDDIAWRVTAWTIRRMVAGGLKFEPVDSTELAAMKLSTDAIGLRVKHMGQFAPHDTAKRAGFKVGDVIVKFDKWSQPMTEGQLLASLMRETKPGQTLLVEVQRGDKRLSFQLVVQE